MMYQFFRKRLLLALFALAAAGGLLSSAQGQILTRVETEFDGFGGVSGITGAFDVALSPDGEHVYVIGSLPVEGGSLAVFSRDNVELSGTFGQVTFIEALFDDGIILDPGDPGMGIPPTLGSIDGLRGPRGVTVSPDGKHVYAVALTDQSVVVFSRNTDDMSGDFGKLTKVETIVQAGNNGLGGAHGVIVSPDGEHVYIASRADDAVAVYSRDEATGMLLHIEAHFDGISGVSGLADAERLTLSPDGKHLYVASEGGTILGPGSGSVAVFSRNTTAGVDFGKLTFVESHTDGVGGADGLLNPTGVAISPDGKFVYVSNNAEDDSSDWIGIFSRNGTTGALTFVSKLAAGIADLCTSSFSVTDTSDIAVSPNGETVIASSNRVGAVVSFSRNETTGILTIADQECDELGDEGILTINAVALSPDGRHVYTTGLGGPASLVFLTTGVGFVQPDGLIGKSLTSLLGDDVYNTNAAGQKLTLVSKRLKTAKFQGRLENDGNIGDRIGLKATRGNGKFAITYLDSGANVTAGITKGTLERVLTPGEQRMIQVKVKPSRKLKNRKTGKIKRKTKTLTITATSKVDGTKVDVVKGTVKAK